ncbi:hypothetical protein ACHAW5_009948 [Stephanodiscus triporus]|uniref:Uncharacterized protein n=1 Tax=Stephanodiscus triporus TaxID=2934178 RepID=A0ABD3NK84_9STRA
MITTYVLFLVTASSFFGNDGEAETYRNVHVTFVPGKKAIMTIYEGDSDVWVEGMEEREQIVLSDYETKSEEEINATKLQNKKDAEEKEQQRAERREAMRRKRNELQKEAVEDMKMEANAGEDDGYTVTNEEL